MRSNLRLRVGLGLALLIALAAPVGRADAAFTSYGNRAAFAAAIGTPSFVETWDGVPNNTVIPSGGSLNGIQYTLSAGNGIVTNQFLPLTLPNTLGRTGNPGGPFFNPGDFITFTFTQPIVAFGINMNTFATAAGSFTATANGIPAPNVAQSGFNPFPGFTTGQFVGFQTDQNVLSVRLNSPGGASFTLDNLSIVYAPEPASMTLLATGAVMLAGFGWRRRRAAQR